MEAVLGIFSGVFLFVVLFVFASGNISYKWENGNLAQKIIYRSSKMTKVIICWPFIKLGELIEFIIPIIWLLIKWGVVLGVGAYGLITAPIIFLLAVIAVILFEILKRMK